MHATTLLGMFLAGLIAQQPPAGSAPQTPAPAATAQEKPISANLKVRIATSTYLADGRVISASANDWPLAINKTITAHALTGKTFCEQRAATVDQPADAGPGWRLHLTPVREAAGELELQADWRQISPGQVDWKAPVTTRGVYLGTTTGGQFFPPSGTGTLQHFTVAGQPTTLKLHPGDRIVVDYMTVGNPYRLYAKRLALTSKDELQSRASNAPSSAAPESCNAIGMSLEIGLEPAKTEAIVEAELWLVRPNRDGSELSERQVLRLPVGQPPSSYYFDEARLVPAQDATKGSAYLAKISGELAAFSIENGKIHLNFKVSRRYEIKQPNADSTSSYRDLVAAPGEVLAFQLPSSPQLSVRLRAQVLR